MIYGKLPVIFLSTLASEKNHSTNSIIASYILEHREDVKNMGIKDLASECRVAMSSISRFCKDIGLRDFAELRELLLFNDMYFEEQSQSLSLHQRIEDYSQKVYESIQMVKNTIDEKQIIKLCQDIKNYQRVAIFGLLKAGSVAINLQGDFLMLNKQIYTNISYPQQIEYILNTDDKDLIIILSYTGAYFDYEDLRANYKKLKAPKIWMISSQQKTYPDFVNEVLSFESLQDQSSHPYQLQFIASIIAQEYAKRYK